MDKCMQSIEKTFLYETIVEANEGTPIICGIDEVGRGPWAGPVVACAAVVDQEIEGLPIIQNVQDSKKLNPSQREEIFHALDGKLSYALGIATVEEIDNLNILQATFLAMHRAVENLPIKPHGALIDGHLTPPNWSMPCEAVKQGDQKILPIAVASIMAKVMRDRMMVVLAKEFPQFGWDTNMGYGTPQHITSLREFGITRHHRQSFKPIQAFLQERGYAKTA